MKHTNDNKCDVVLTFITSIIIINGRLKTHKDNAKLHGIGMNSISRALSAYNGSLDWKYNKEQKIFSTTIIIQNLTA